MHLSDENSAARGPRLRRGLRVRDRKWGGISVGTVTSVRGDSVYVAWAGTIVEDELTPEDVVVISEEEFRAAVGSTHPRPGETS